MDWRKHNLQKGRIFEYYGNEVERKMIDLEPRDESTLEQLHVGVVVSKHNIASDVIYWPLNSPITELHKFEQAVFSIYLNYDDVMFACDININILYSEQPNSY